MVLFLATTVREFRDGFNDGSEKLSIMFSKIGEFFLDMEVSTVAFIAIGLLVWAVAAGIRKEKRDRAEGKEDYW